MNILLPGDYLGFHVHKADGSVYRKWRARIQYMDESTLVTIAPLGDPVEDSKKGLWYINFSLRSYYWFDKPYNLLEVFAPDGSLAEIYLNVASKPEIMDGILHFSDFELDVSRRPPNKSKIIDQDEFAEAIRKFGYSAEFQQQAWQIAYECQVIADEWNASPAPVFD
jgi:protein associated with RNAse G/E